MATHPQRFLPSRAKTTHSKEWALAVGGLYAMTQGADVLAEQLAG